MTYLECVNRVLRRLRENEVTTVTETPYSKLIGDLVNVVKVEVEDSWNWSALRTTLQLIQLTLYSTMYLLVQVHVSVFLISLMIQTTTL